MLDCTPKEIKARNGGTVINPAKTCQPIGAMYAALGIHKCLPHSHGSQGCCSYHRMHLSRHFRDPIMASTSSFTEGASVFGGGANLKTAIKNVFSIYNPDVMAVHTTCLSETIGDDLPTVIKSAEIPEGKRVIHANTPSYQGSHITGFSNMTKAMVNYLAEAALETKKEQANIIPGFVNPGDMREMKRMTTLMGVPFILFPDTSGVVDTPITGEFHMYPNGGTRVEDLIDTGNSKVTIALGTYASADAANQLERKCQVPSVILKTPIGVKATDDFLMTLMNKFTVDVPPELEEERGQLVDIMTDTHFHFHGKKVAIFGDPDIVIGLTEFVLSLGMKPIHVLTGTPGSGGAIGTMVGNFEGEIKDLLKQGGVEGRVKAAGDLFELHQWIKNEPVDLLIGNTYGKYIARAEDIPFLRVGFPVLDRSVHSYMPIVGYRGAMRLVEMISNALLDRADRDAKDEDFELVM
ncbi:nitrogenase molybdenum-iron protein subunit beta [Desulforamulus ruminis]|uniref:Nitrogenase molybdenum-iron protein beta chain n=1 Tax=Desulforamulus ruminis (strain ATCC 23193 / DSM 2154 / NCIMB 8452 / DL) TaxID=696281 RepID=F6DLL1_DESRL|nr:nitrogenase molybdenum-iron protein subunit beta [Desulforamulus ruminis]AEG61653.1 nitrogenase molybdenum-iron protein beta chain [Desulforamulus ruminis DSM 2154]